MSATDKSGGSSSSQGAGDASEDTVDGEDQDDSTSSSVSPQDSLETFRKQWKLELYSNKNKFTSQENKAGVKESTDYNVEDKAKVYFQLGVEYEENGKLYEAVQFYKKAVQLVPDIEFKISQQIVFTAETDHVEDVIIDKAEYTDEVESSDEEEVQFDPQSMDLMSHLQNILSKQKQRSICTPERPQSMVHISSLPMEVILYLLRWVVSSELDLRSLDVFARVCRGFYLCARDKELWRSACTRLWGVKCGHPGKQYKNWREMFIKRPRLQFDGCYISKTTYIRHGENSFQDQFYRPWHLVQYYRYLRFFADGTVHMLTTSDEPITCVGALRVRNPTQKGPPIYTGYYRMHENVVSLILTQSNLTRPKSNTNYSGAHHRCQTYHVELEIVTLKNRLHVQLAWRGYKIFQARDTGPDVHTVFDLTASRYPPFWFSRVKSYSSESYFPLL